MNSRVTPVLLALLMLATLAACSRMQPEASGITPVAEPSEPPAPTQRPALKPSAAPKPTVVPTPHISADASKNPVLRLQQAIEKTKTVMIYRLDFTTAYTLPPNSTPASIVVRVAAEMDGLSMHTVYTDSSRPYGDSIYETVINGGNGYVRNPQAPPGAPNEWFMSPHVLPVRRAQLAPTALLDTFIGQKINFAEFQADKETKLDERACTTYRSEGDAALRALNVLQGDTSSASTNVNEHLTKRDMTFWLCDDGYIHQVSVGLAGDDGKQPASNISYAMKLHLFDFNGAIRIVPPSFAMPLPPEAAQATQPEQNAQADQSAPSAPNAALTATVFNGGNVREVPVSGKPLDQINAQETVELLGKNANGAWYFIRNIRGATGWVSASLLTVAANVAAQVPVAPADVRGTAPSAPAASAGAQPAASLPITKLVAFTHKSTGVSGLRPENWQIFSGRNGFQISSSPEAPDGLSGIVIAPQQYGSGSAAQTSRDMLNRFKQNQADGPAPQVLDEQIAADGSGFLLVNVTGLAQGSSTPIRLTHYVRTTITAQGMLVAIGIVPAAQYDAEAALVRQMVDSLKLGVREQF